MTAKKAPVSHRKVSVKIHPAELPLPVHRADTRTAEHGVRWPQTPPRPTHCRPSPVPGHFPPLSVRSPPTLPFPRASSQGRTSEQRRAQGQVCPHSPHTAGPATIANTTSCLCPACPTVLTRTWQGTLGGPTACSITVPVTPQRAPTARPMRPRVRGNRAPPTV